MTDMPAVGTRVRVTEGDHKGSEGTVEGHLPAGQSVYSANAVAQVRLWPDSQDQGDGVVDYEPQELEPA